MFYSAVLTFSGKGSFFLKNGKGSFFLQNGKGSFFLKFCVLPCLTLSERSVTFKEFAFHAVYPHCTLW